jgi:6-phosphogluconolactonase (cycloisomerase 2 family)
VRDSWRGQELLVIVIWHLLVTPLWAQFVYVANSTDNTISGYSIGSNGKLVPVPGSPFGEGNFIDYTFSLVVHPSGKHLYVGNFAAYNIGDDGSLSFIPGARGYNGCISIAAQPRGNFVYAADYYGNFIYSYRVGSKGDLFPTPESSFSTGYNYSAGQLEPISVTVSPTSEFVYVANYGTANVSVYRIDPAGDLTLAPGSGVAAGGHPSGVAVHPRGQFVYVVNQSDAINIYEVGCEGGISALPDSPFSFSILGGGADALAIEPRGEFVYMVSGSSNIIIGFRVNTDGTLSVAGSSVATGPQPSSVAVDPNGGFVYVANFTGNNVSGYSIADDGTLTPIPGSPFAAGKNPAAIAIGPLPR